jgi:hypothetical protein
MGDLTATVRITPDEDGFLGRECPTCERYFKITPGIGLEGTSHCICPYCGENRDGSEFLTREQIEYARSVALREFSATLLGQLKRREFTSRPTGGFGIGISLKVEGEVIPIEPYQERVLETEVVCDRCGLRYAVYGVFAFCPDCGIRNSLQVLTSSLAFAARELDLAESDTEHAARWSGEALASAVSAFDAFGRETCLLYAEQATEPAKAQNVSFQAIGKAAEHVRKLFAIDLTTFVSQDEWRAIVTGFQKRHLVAHRAGVIDEQYIAATGDTHAEVSRKIRIEVKEVRLLLDLLARLASAFNDTFTSNQAAIGPMMTPQRTSAASAHRAPKASAPRPPGNPFGLSNDAIRLAEAVAEYDSDLGYGYVSDADIATQASLKGLALEAAVRELEDAHLVTTQWVGGRTFIEGTPDLPRAIAQTLDYNPASDDLLVAETAVASENWMTGPDLVAVTGLTLARLNRAVLRLKARKQLEVMQTAGMAPYRFRQVKATGDTLRFTRSRK